MIITILMIAILVIYIAVMVLEIKSQKKHDEFVNELIEQNDLLKERNKLLAKRNRDIIEQNNLLKEYINRVIFAVGKDEE